MRSCFIPIGTVASIYMPRGPDCLCLLLYKDGLDIAMLCSDNIQQPNSKLPCYGDEQLWISAQHVCLNRCSYLIAAPVWRLHKSTRTCVISIGTMAYHNMPRGPSVCVACSVTMVDRTTTTNSPNKLEAATPRSCSCSMSSSRMSSRGRTSLWCRDSTTNLSSMRLVCRLDIRLDIVDFLHMSDDMPVLLSEVTRFQMSTVSKISEFTLESLQRCGEGQMEISPEHAY
jgi:hypothetical protein